MGSNGEWLYPIKGMHEYRGVLCMPDTTESVLKWMEEDLQFEEGDVLLCAYPCSGDTWLQDVVWHIHNLDRLDDQNKGTIGRRVPHIDHEFFNHKHPKEFFNEISAPRVFKSRMPANLLERHLEGKAKVIFWSMDPRDTLLKYQHLYNTKGKHLNFPEIDFEGFYRLFQEKQLFEGDWFDTTKSFLPYIGKPNFLYLRYEEEAQDPAAIVRKIAKFLDINLTDELVERLANICPFDKPMGWESKFTSEQLISYRKAYAEKMKGTILENTYI